MVELPPALRDEVRRTLTPIRPLARPWRRAALLLPVALAVLVAVPLVWRLREDAAAVGTLRLWGGSLLQVIVALALIGAAFAESTPGRLAAPTRLFARAALGVAFMVALTFVTFAASPTTVSARLRAFYLPICMTRAFALGLPPLAAALLLMARGLAARPIVAGALAGLGAGLVADSGWRLFCEVADPVHVLTAHAGAIVALSAAGAAIGAAVRLTR